MTVRNFDTYDNNGKRPAPTAKSANELLVQTARYALTSTIASALAANDLFRVCDLPKGHIMADGRLDTDDLDTGASLDISMGLLNDAGTDIIASTEFIKDSTDHQSAYTSRFKHEANSKLKARQYHETNTTTEVNSSVRFWVSLATRVTSRPAGLRLKNVTGSRSR